MYCLNIHQEIEKLKNSNLLKSDKDINDFEEAITRIVGVGDLICIKYLCAGFHDDTEHDEIMFGLIHAIESFDQNYPLYDTLKELAESVPLMFPHAKEWAKTLHKRILNHKSTLEIYVDVVSRSNTPTKNLIAEIVTEIKHKNPSRFEESADRFLSSI